MSETDIVIVGAGAAGIAAARRLREQRCTTLVLEARDRVGGRAWTNAALGVPVDMGCAWLHSADTNPWTTYAQDHHFTLDRRLPEWGAYVAGHKLDDATRAEWGAAFARNEALLAQAAERGIDVAIDDLLPRDKYRARFDAVVALLMGSDSRRMSSADYANYGDTDINWAVREGLGALVAHAAGSVDVRLSTEVTRIETRGQAVEVDTSAGVLRAKAAIVTLPTNLLAQERLQFLPALPARFSDAIAALPLGANNKVFFRMKPASLPFADSINFVRTQDDARVGSYQAWPAGQEALLCYFGGDLAIELEQRGGLEAFARDELAQMFGSEFPTRIEQSLCTGWVSDQWSQGSYSYAVPGQAQKRVDLSEPIHERVFYAGEACSLRHAGTIHGAWHSGVSAADKALAVVRAH